MQQLVSVFVDIAFHRKGPDAVPASRFLFALVLLAYLAISLTIWQIIWPVGQAFGIMALDVAMHLVFFGIVLILTGHSARFLQTVTAVLGAETFLGCIALPLRLIIARGSDADPFVTTATFLLILVVFWSIDVTGFVLARALERSYIVGVLIVIGYVLSSMALGEFFFPFPQ